MKIKVKSHNWEDGDEILEGVEVKDFFYDVSESGLKNALFLGKNAIELEPDESLELSKWLFINSIRGQLSSALMRKDTDCLNEITDYCSDFIEEIQQANLDFNAKSVMSEQYQAETDKATQDANIRKLAMAACSYDENTREEILSDPTLMTWLKNELG